MASNMSRISFGLLMALSCLVLFASMSSAETRPNPPPLKVGFYQYSCPKAEAIVKKHVSDFVSKNPGLAAGLIRLHFHDCFVRGCDGSVLLDGANSEKESIPNKGSLRGFEIIDAAKAELERACPNTVSCADALAFAARDASCLAGGISYPVPSGRRDGRVSSISDPLVSLPAPFLNASALRDNFARKNLSLDDMVTLSGSHSIGLSHCSSFSGRLYPTPDPTLDPRYAAALMRVCPPPPANATQAAAAKDPTVSLDSLTPGVLDNKYYAGLKAGRGLLTSDQALYGSPLTSGMVLGYAANGEAWGKKFAAAMVKMGEIEVLTGVQGEVRRMCRVVN